MESVGAYEAKTHLPALLKKVERGEKIVITKHGVPVAVLQPVSSPGKRDVGEVIEEMRRLATKNRLRGLPLKDLIAEGRR
jgi:prevent-host-death family protein